MSRRSVGRYLGRLAYQIAEEYARSANTSHRAIKTKGESSDVPFFVQTVNEEWNREEKQHRKEEKDFWRKSLQFTAIAGVAAAIAAGFSIGAFFEARRQAAAAEETNRPWLYIDRVDAVKVAIDDHNKMGSVVDVYVSNLGHSIATDIHLDAAIYSVPALYVAEIESFCKAHDIDAFVETTNGRSSFPERPIVVSGGVEPLQLEKNASMDLIELRLCLHYRTSGGEEHRTGTFFLFKGLKQITPSEVKDVHTTQDYLAGAYAD